MLKNIVLDFGNVIMNWNPDEILNHYALTSQQRDLLKKIIFTSKEWTQIDAGKITEAQAERIFLKKAPADLKVKVKQIMATWPQNVDFYENMFYLIKKSRRQGYRIYGLSNTGMQFAHFVQNSEIGDCFAGFVFSAQEKLMKPDHRIYQRLLTKYHLKASECLLVDDRPENTTAAETCGMHAFTFNIKKLPALRQTIQQLSQAD